MDYREKAIELIQGISDQSILEYVYIMVSDIAKEDKHGLQGENH